MAGNTGKMTKEAIAARGSRLALVRIGGQLVICRENDPTMFKATAVIAHSYSRSYLNKLIAANS